MTNVFSFDWTVTLGQAITFMTLIAGFIYTWLKEGRARKWAEEDAAKKDRHLIRQDTAISEGSGAAKEAYNEANALNGKILTLQEQLKHVAKRKADRPSTPTQFTRETDQEKQQ